MLIWANTCRVEGYTGPGRTEGAYLGTVGFGKLAIVSVDAWSMSRLLGPEVPGPGAVPRPSWSRCIASEEMPGSDWRILRHLNFRSQHVCRALINRGPFASLILPYEVKRYLNPQSADPGRLPAFAYLRVPEIWIA